MIRSKEAHCDKDSLQTVIDGRRPLCYISICNSPIKDSNGDIIGYLTSSISENYLLDKVKENNLNAIKVKDGTYIIYIKSAHDKAKELLDIALKYDGYLHYNAIESDTRRIGELLSYHPDDINDFINKKKKL